MGAPFKLISMSEMMTRQATNPPSYFIDQVMKANTFNLFVGDADAGKSCLTRQLAACVVTGTDFLGWKVQQSSVLYFTIEQDPEQISVEMTTLGLGTDHKFYLSRDEADTPEQFVAALRATLQQDPAIKFVVLDTLGRFLPSVNIDSYSEATPHMLNFQKLCYDCGVTILALHHFNKHGLSLATKISGSTALKSAADTTLALWGTGKSKRYLESDGRCKYKIPRTLLTFDETTRKSTLRTVTGAAPKPKAGASEVTVESDEPKIANVAEIVKANPGITQQDLLVLLEGRKADKFSEIRKLVDQGTIVETGKGRRGDPLTYTEASAPITAPAHVGIAVVPTPAQTASATAPTVSIDDQIVTLNAKIRTEQDANHKAELVKMRTDLQAKKRASAA